MKENKELEPNAEFEIEGEDESDLSQDNNPFTEYDISASPNDFNISTLFSFIGSGVVKIPGFQRNYVWDIKRASKLIESIIIGIPIPQIFLFEESKNKFSVIDGQQRYMTIYYFMKKRFPRKERRTDLRLIFEQHKNIPEEYLNNNDYFVDFNLSLSVPEPNSKNRLNGLNYFTLDEDDKISFEMRTIRNIIIKQNDTSKGFGAIYEIFNRLNSGGVNLKPQEIRTSLYHSPFYDMLYELNLNPLWRKLTPSTVPDLHMKDVEILLRGFAMLEIGDKYKPSMSNFLNEYSFRAKSYKSDKILYLKNLALNFIESAYRSDNKIFIAKSGRFNISVYEAIFVAICSDNYCNETLKSPVIIKSKVDALKSDKEFIEATQSETASAKNVKIRLQKSLMHLM